MTYKIDRKQVNILGIKISSTPSVRVLRFIRSNLVKWNKSQQKDEALFITTPNPEQLVLAQKDKDFGKILNKADIAIPDAIGLAVANKFLKLPRPENLAIRFLALCFQGLMVGFSVLINKRWLESDLRPIKGRKFFLDLIGLANKKKYKTVLLGDGEQSAQEAMSELKLNYKSVQLFAISGPGLDEDGNPIATDDQKIERDVIAKVQKIKPHFLFVGFGAPKQEKWVYRWFSRLPVGCVMVVGGTYNYISGKTRLPPKLIENLSLEWLWRFLTGNQSLKRIITASIIFPLKVFISKLMR